MTPFSFEWQWNIDYLVFMGLLYTALIIIGCGITFVITKTVLQVFGFMRERHF
jgi:hypothetical protein